MTVQQATDALALLPAAQQKEAIAAAGVQLPAPNEKTASALWIMIVGALIVLLLAGGFLLFWLVDHDKSTEVILPLVTGALTAIVGLLAPSPVAQQ